MNIPGYLAYAAAIAVPLTTILVFVEKARKSVVDAYAWVWRLLAPKGNPHRVELRITPDRTGHCQWIEGSEGGKPTMMALCRLYLTNVGPCKGFQVLDVSIRKPKTQGFEAASMMGRPNPQITVLPTDTRLAVVYEARFTVLPPVVKSGEKFIADIVLVDQFAKKHVAKKVEFKPMGGSGWANLEKQLQTQKESKQP